MMASRRNGSAGSKGAKGALEPRKNEPTSVENKLTDASAAAAAPASAAPASAASRRDERRAKPSASSSVSAVEQEVGKSIDRSKKATSGVFLALRIVLFALACVFAVVGVRGFVEASDTQTTSKVVTVESIQGKPVRHAVVIFSGDDSDSGVGYERSGVQGVLGPSGVSCDMYYMRSPSKANARAVEKNLSKEIQKHANAGVGCDVVIAVGNDALRFVSSNRDLFGGIPAAFFAVTDTSLADAARKQGVATGYVEVGAPSLSLNNAATLLPSYNRVVVLADGSAQANGLLDQLRADKLAATGYEREVWNTTGKTRAKLAEELATLDSHTFVLLLSANCDSSGTTYSSVETAYFLADATRAPVFSALGGVGEGVCGAAFFDRETEGTDAAKLAIELLNGTDPSTIPVVELEPECGVFDVQALEGHNLNADDTPEGSALVNESTFSARVLRPFLRPALFLLAAILCIVGFAIIGFRRSVQSNKAIIASRDELRYRLYHDVLTDLPNRFALDQLVQSPGSQEEVKAVVRVDVNDFADVNDSYGHAFGDEVIKILAMRLSRVKSKLLVRSGGADFTLAFTEPLDESSSVLSHIRRIFNDPVIVGDNKVDVTAAVGIANREEGMTGEDLLSLSDLALNVAKDEGLNTPVFYAEDMRESMERKIAITAYLKQAIADESIVVLWQPQVDTEKLTVYGYEALCRLEGNKYYPDQFIPVAEMSGLVNPLDRIVTKKVIQQLGTWLKEGRENVGVASINFSAAQLRDKGYCDYLASLLAEYGVPASLIKIEITESMIIGNEEEADKLFARLRSMGITLALDDFGTGYSSLYRMASRPVDFVKLDKSLVDTFMVSGKDGFIDDVTRLIHGLNKTLVVEGVETYEQYQICLNYGCDIIQGYFFARPMTAEEAINLDPGAILAKARSKTGDKTRNGDWHKYDRDEHGRWKKAPKK